MWIGSIRDARPNNVYMKNYYKVLPDSYIIHYDINGMYSHIMSDCKLPYDDF